MRCPVTLGPIEATTGEPVTQSFKKKKAYKAGRAKADPLFEWMAQNASDGVASPSEERL